MTENIKTHYMAKAVLAILEETFVTVNGIYLDKGTSLFETLETVTAEEASRPVSANCANIAAHVEHIRLSIDVVMKYMQGEKPKVDWTEIWRTVRDVTSEEWQANQDNLREAYNRLCVFVTNIQKWETDATMVLAILAHNAYHLGEIRHALCTIKPNR